MLLAILPLLVLQLPATQATGPAPYWQQRVVYQINARLDEPSNTLSGDERVKYINHSPDTLHTISFHLYLNAFRPGSRWVAADSAERVHRFDKLKDPDFGFNHVRNVTIDGTPVVPFWPLAPDSTIVRFTLPRPLAPGDSLNVTMDWDARVSTVPRRQGRLGRHYDFAQWYPKVVVYDKFGWEEHALYPAGEFYGEFGDFFVKLDVPKDQVVGATGVPMCGNPGWPISLDGGYHVGPYRAEPAVEFDGDSGNVCSAGGLTISSKRMPPSDRKQMIWVAHDVHNFAMTMSPDYRYEGGEWNGIQVHVLYQPGDTATWGHGIVVNNTIETLKWLNFIFGPYPWPQMTVAHRIEGGGTEFPMMQMNGSPSQGLNLHEGGHSYLMGILANNEWREGWMDEGFTSFQTTWWSEAQGKGDGPARNIEASMLQTELDGDAEPVSLVSEKYRDFQTYNAMIYNRGELFLLELKRIVGDETMLEILRTYYARWKLRHVDEDAFKAVAEEVTHRDLSAFFAQWLHGTVLTDYAIGKATRRASGTGWTTSVDVLRKAPGQFPVTVLVLAAHDTALGQVSGIGDRETVTIVTNTEPQRVLLDPAVYSHDWNFLNNQHTFGFHPRTLLGGDEPTRSYFDKWFWPEISRDSRTIGWMPVAWYNDAGGATVGVHRRDDYLGDYNQLSGTVTYGSGIGASGADTVRELGIDLSLRNPTWWRIPGVTERIDAFRIEGRTGAGIEMERVHSPHLGFGPTHTLGGSLRWTATYNLAYLDSALWNDGGTAEAAVWAAVSDTRGGWTMSLKATVAGGVSYARPGAGITTENRYDVQPYARPELEATARRTLGKRATLSVRGYAAGVFSHDPVLAQRRLYVAGADPYQEMSNPFLRSTGALLAGSECWCRWQTPGGGDLRGIDQTVATDRLASVNAELETTVFKPKSTLVSQLSIAAFADGGAVGSSRWIGGSRDNLILTVWPDRWLGDAGLGLRLNDRIGDVRWTTRLDFPLAVSEPAYAIAHTGGRFALDRLVVSFSPVIR